MKRNMKWQKNTGVMPCDKTAIVSTRTEWGGVSWTRVAAGTIEWWDTKTNHRFYIHQYDEVPPDDYVEPKVWTVERRVDSQSRHFDSFQRKEQTQLFVYGANAVQVKVIEDALNAWEESNGNA